MTFVNVKYYDRCELLNDCPEGQHLGACCGDGEVFIQTNTVRAYSGSATYSEGVCCPQTRPNWNGSKCMP